MVRVQVNPQTEPDTQYAFEFESYHVYEYDSYLTVILILIKALQIPMAPHPDLDHEF